MGDGQRATGNGQLATGNYMSTLTKFSAIPYTGPAPTNRTPYVPVNADAADARGAELAAKFGVEQETRQDMATLVVP